jgi:F1F0 ATPase subunit 2
MMIEYLGLTGALLAGIAVGGLFFAGLLWTVRKSASVKQPAVWLFGSLILRTGGVLTAFYVIGKEDWRRWVACLAGFVLARTCVVLLVRPERRITPHREVSDAPES